MKNKKKKTSTKNNKLHWVHLTAIILLVSYFLLSKANTVHAISSQEISSSFIQIYLFGALFACIFLYILSHERFFPIAKEIKKRQETRENKYLNKYKHHSKVLTTLIIGALGGPIFSSLTARILLKNFKFKYIIVLLANVPSSLATITLGHSLIYFINI